MGLNTIHDISNDLIRCYNETQKKFFRCEIMGEKECRQLEVAKGLGVYAVTLAIRVNGHCEINPKDRIRVLGKHMMALTLSNSFDNPELFRKRADYNNFTGETIIGLQ